MGPKQWFHLILTALQISTMPVKKKGVREARMRLKRRLRACQGCPVYDKSLKRCRPFTGAPWGCGCYVPYIALGDKPCWARGRLPDAGWE